MLFIFILFVFATLAFVSLFTKKVNLIIPKISFVFLFFFSIFRYSLGADYFAYAFIYKALPSNLIAAYEANVHSELLFKTLIVFFKAQGFSYEIFLAVVTGIMLYFFAKPILNKSKNPMISIMLFYGFYYMIYINSAIRQGLAMSMVFYGVSYYYLNSAHKKFFATVFIASLFHVSAWFVLLIYVADFIYRRFVCTKKYHLLLIIYLLGVGTINLTPIPYFIFIDVLKITRLESYLDGHINWISLASKLVFFSLITVLYLLNRKHKDILEEKYYLFYVTGIAFYLVAMSMPISSRILDFFTMFEILLIPSVISYQAKKVRSILLFSMSFILTLFMFTKDIHSFTYQEGYKNPKITNYRYFTIFDKKEVRYYKKSNMYVGRMITIDKKRALDARRKKLEQKWANEVNWLERKQKLEELERRGY